MRHHTLFASARLIHTLLIHPSPPFEPSRIRRGWHSPTVMAATQVARAITQLHEAAQDVARVAALRSAKPQELMTQPPMLRHHGYREGADYRVSDAAEVTAPVSDQDA